MSGRCSDNNVTYFSVGLTALSMPVFLTSISPLPVDFLPPAVATVASSCCCCYGYVRHWFGDLLPLMQWKFSNLKSEREMANHNFEMELCCLQFSSKNALNLRTDDIECTFAVQETRINSIFYELIS